MSSLDVAPQPRLQAGSLEGLTLTVDERRLRLPSYTITPTGDEFRNGALMRQYFYTRHLLDAVQEAGAEIEAVHPFDRSLSLKPDTYMFDGTPLSLREPDITAELDELGIRRTTTSSLDDYLFSPLRERPAVLCNTVYNAGNCKYALDTEEQKEKVAGYLSRNPHISEDFVVRELVETPSDRYTSYRVLVDTTGDILASGLLYSRQSKQFGRPVALDGRPANIYARDFEDPKSEYYLAARDIRSNLCVGGSVIPLQGTFAGQTEHGDEPVLQRHLLADHGIDPTHPELPCDIAEQARAIGELVCQSTALVVGVDMLADANNGLEPVFLEYNTFAGAKTFQACHAADTYRDDWYYRACMQSAAIENIAAQRN